MTEGCTILRPLPERAFKQRDTEEQWAKDAAAYEACRLRYYALRSYYRKRDAALRSNQ